MGCDWNCLGFSAQRYHLKVTISGTWAINPYWSGAGLPEGSFALACLPALTLEVVRTLRNQVVEFFEYRAFPIIVPYLRNSFPIPVHLAHTLMFLDTIWKPFTPGHKGMQFPPPPPLFHLHFWGNPIAVNAPSLISIGTPSSLLAFTFISVVFSVSQWKFSSSI